MTRGGIGPENQIGGKILSRPWTLVWTALGAASLFWFLFTAGLTILRYRMNYASAYDFGLFSQMYYYMDKCLLPLTTCERDGLLSHFAVHLSPIFYLLLPLYKLFPRPETLLATRRAWGDVSFRPDLLRLPRLSGRLLLRFS